MGRLCIPEKDYHNMEEPREMNSFLALTLQMCGSTPIKTEMFLEFIFKLYSIFLKKLHV